MAIHNRLPTLIFTECVLAYIDQQSIEAFLTWTVKAFDCLALLDYDMVNPNDPFGKMMVYNFKQRGIPLIGMDFFESLAKVKQSLESRGLAVEIASMRDMYYKHLDQQERARIEKLEFLDELEEFWLVQEHYFISLAKSKHEGIKAGNELRFEVIEGTSLFSLNNK